MDTRKTIAAKNIKTLLELDGDSITGFAKRAGMAPSTLTTFLKYPEERNITLDHLLAISDICGIELWMLLVINFPFGEVKNKKINTISADGYTLLCLYEQAANEKRKSILDYISYQLRDSPTEQRVRDIQTRYLTTQTQTQAQYRHPTCNEDHGK